MVEDKLSRQIYDKITYNGEMALASYLESLALTQINLNQLQECNESLVKAVKLRQEHQGFQDVVDVAQSLMILGNLYYHQNKI